MSLMSRGSYYAIGAYVTWGVIPIYVKWLQGIPALALASHRVLWSCLMLCLTLLILGQWPALIKAARQPRILGLYALAAVIIGFNWMLFIWAVNEGYIVEMSLGNYINPLLSMLTGAIFLRERLRPWQWLPVVLVAAGVLYLTLAFNSLPWIGLLLAINFSIYGLIKKVAPLDALTGLTLETTLLMPFALAYLLYADHTHSAALVQPGLTLNLLLIGTGATTIVPLLMFSAAARRITLTQLGILQYIGPTVQILLGIFLYDEPFPQQRMLGYGLIWSAMALFTVEGYLVQRRQIPTLPPTV